MNRPLNKALPKRAHDACHAPARAGWLRRRLRLAIWGGLMLACSLGALHPARAGDKPREEEKAAGKTEEGKKKKKKKKKSVDRLEVPIPVNHNAGGIKVSDHDKDGQLQTVFQIGSAFRVNEDQLQMSNLRIETFNSEGTLETEISMESAALNLITREIVSEKPVTIRRTGFEITGSHFAFRTRERNGTFQGPVKVLIFNRDDLDETKKQEGHEDAGEREAQ